MQPTYIGFIAAAIGLMAMTRQMTFMLMAIVCAGILGASSAVTLTALGGASVQPAFFMLLFLAVRMAQDKYILSDRLIVALKECYLFIIFAVYGAISAYIFPRLFRGQIELPPTKILSDAIFYMAPLAPSSQNITQSTYLLGTLAMLLATIYIARRERRSRMVAMTLVGLGVFHVIFGIVDLVSDAAGLNVFEVVRNSTYQIVDQSYGSFHRIQGTFSETSSYSAFGYILLVFIAELWVRGVEEKWTGPVAAALALALAFTTSSSAYIGLSVYAFVLGLRLMYIPSKRGQTKAIILGAIVIATGLLIMAIAVLSPLFLNSFVTMLLDMTVNKGQSMSGIQRGFWVRKGWEAFMFSHGLGVGVGSFRSSSLLSAIAGSMGVVGALSFFAFAYRVLPIHKPATFRLDGDKTQAVGAAAGWSAIMGLAPAFVSAANPDPGIMYAFMAGLAIAWAPYSPNASAKSGA